MFAKVGNHNLFIWCELVRLYSKGKKKKRKKRKGGKKYMKPYLSQSKMCGGSLFA
jgi:hypothetical protein